MRRGRWTYQPEHQAWQLDDSGWYLSVRTGLMRVFRGCAYCWGLEDDRRWVLYQVDPVTWREPRHYTDCHYAYRPAYGHCTHRRRLADAMPLVEKKFAEHVLKTLSELLVPAGENAPVPKVPRGARARSACQEAAQQRDTRTRRKDQGKMALPVVSGRTVVIGGGLHAAVIAATMAACGKEPPVVIEKRRFTGGIFADLAPFRMNSATAAGVRSVESPGPTRAPQLSPSDDLNWVPNADTQLRALSGMVEYPCSTDMAKLIQQTLAKYADVYCNTEIEYDRTGQCFRKESGEYCGASLRVIFAGGLAEPPSLPQGRGIMSGYAFMKKPVRALAGKRIALIGGGDTASQVAELAVGQGLMMPTSFPDQIDWYGGTAMPPTKETWMRQIHARWAGVGRHFPDRTDTPSCAVFRPHLERGEVSSLGNTAWVNGQVYDLVIMATGFVPALYPVASSSSLKIQGKVVARYYDDGSGQQRIFRVGTAAELNVQFKPYASRFPAAKEAIYNLAPRTAAFAASLP